jgi:hypothetical protein
MKTHNLHALWHKEPLRLTSEQTENPKLVLTDFFQCYHLQDVRQIMWHWLTEAISSPNSHSSDHHERNNYMFFYEKMETLVEATWIINRGTGQITNPARPMKSTRDRKPVQQTPITAQPGRFSKPARLIEKAASQPNEVIAEVFSHAPLYELQEYLLPTWLRVAIINTESPYSAGKGREILCEFYDQLLRFVESLYRFSNKSTDTSTTLLSAEQVANPTLVINAFFQQFAIDYLRRELSDFLDAGIGYEGCYPNGFTPWQAWMVYNHILCLVEAAYQLYLNQQMQPVTHVLSQQMVELKEVV